MPDTRISPALSVVVVTLGGPSQLRRCLEALTDQHRPGLVEILVPLDDNRRDVRGLEHRFPGVRLLRVEGRRTYAELRAVGVQSARARIVAMTEDHCTPEPDWCAQILDVHRGPYAAVGGMVEKGPDTALNWAVYLTDYGRYMSPVTEGPASYLTDCNVSYKRSALAGIADVWAREFHETSVHWALRARGETLWLSPRVVVRQQRSFGLAEAVRDRYAFGRLFASTRAVAAGPWARALYVAGSLMLPLLLVTRVACTVVGKQRHALEFVRALPAMLLLTSVWAWGEFMGYLTGVPEASLAPTSAGPGGESRRGRTAPA